jgi:hypothetical protein
MEYNSFKFINDMNYRYSLSENERELMTVLIAFAYSMNQYDYDEAPYNEAMENLNAVLKTNGLSDDRSQKRLQ